MKPKKEKTQLIYQRHFDITFRIRYIKRLCAIHFKMVLATVFILNAAISCAPMIADRQSVWAVEKHGQ